MTPIEPLKFLTSEEVGYIAKEFGTPCFVYDIETIRKRFEYFASLPNAFGLNIRYSVKANPNKAILRLFASMGADFDVSSIWEARRVVNAGIDASRVLITAQEIGAGWQDLCRQGMKFDAGSLRQLEDYGNEIPGGRVSVRINPGFGSGLVRKLTSGGKHSSFGIWVDQADEAFEMAARHRLEIERLHFHIGSGHESTVLEQTVELALSLAARIPSVETIDLGGGYRIAALLSDPTYDHHAMGARIAERLQAFAASHGRRLAIELEPGTYLTALAGSLVTRVIDKVSTGPEGYTFLKIDSGLTELMRPSYYGVVHPLVSVPLDQARAGSVESYIVSGHCCIAGDTLTPAPGNAEDIKPQPLATTEVGDYLVIERVGGYAASMSVKNFNSYPDAPEIVRHAPGHYTMIRKRQSLEHLTQNEIDVDLT